MSLKLSKTNTIPYNYISYNSNSNPVTTELTLDYKTPSVYSSVVVIYLVGNENIYKNISLSITDEDIGIEWFMSFNNSTWFKSIIFNDIDARENDVIIPVYFKSGMLNDGSVMDGSYTRCKIKLDFDEIYK